MVVAGIYELFDVCKFCVCERLFSDEILLLFVGQWLFLFFIDEHGALEADKSAVGAMNRPLRPCRL